MRTHEPVPTDRSRPGEPRRRAEQPSAIEQLLALQRGAGNRAVARFLDVQNIDYDPTSGRFHTGHVNAATFVTTLEDSNFYRTCNPAEKARVQNINTANLAAVDMPTLTDVVIQHVANNLAPRLNALTPHRSNVEGALVVATPRAPKVSDREEGVFKRIIPKATLKSRSKGVPSVIPLTDLNDVSAAMSNGVATTQATVAARNQALGQAATYMAQPSWSTADFAANGLAVRSAHMNMAGWLVQHNVAPTLDLAANNWANHHAGPGGHAGTRQAIVAEFGVAPAVTARDIERSNLPDPAKRRYFNEVVMALPTPRQRATHAWREYAHGTMPGCPFIEFTADQAGGLSRYVWDYVNDAWYVGVHYNWIQGYNPFFHVTGLPSSF
ncbi:hypothetical protein DVA67_033540 [Solirubrobacter sp. CPCC 204708]|uniref:SCP domain-containing protein n=1 Tax=Solirubrobacter deserti TaxID=2282478 RepID=A0ABT4RSW9_9ACTN|nr:hypothetical protein [Solirubrobacter deserti]MBE2320929.1 hypothetical protein [Solirubrobacter deserti]MDA0141675.1 hypothetical protein [Solirubrobacter deserti]